jgi:cobalt-zinc-cadmium efflux system outer membrane protein
VKKKFISFAIASQFLVIGIGLSFFSLAYADCPTPTEFTLTLAQAAIRVAHCNREVIRARHAVIAAEADVRTADRGQNPTLTVGTAYINPQSGIGVGPLWQKQVDWQARIDQPIERGNKRGLRVAVAESALHAIHWTATEALRQQQLVLANAWIDLWSAQERIRVLTDLQALYHRTQDAGQKRLRAGDIAANDLLKIAVDTQRSESDLQQVKAERTRAQYALATILTMEKYASELTASHPWTPLVDSMKAATDLDLAKRPDLQAARAQLESAKDARDLALSQRTRDVNVGVQLDRYPAPAGIGNSISVSFSMPLFVRHSNEGEIARAEADYTTALLSLRKIEQQAVGDQSRLEAERQAAALRANRLKNQLLPLVEKMAANADFAYKKGSASVFDLLDSLKQLRQLQLDLVAAQADYEKADAAAWAATLNFSVDQAFMSSATYKPPIK